jgi:hypothetical protein
MPRNKITSKNNCRVSRTVKDKKELGYCRPGMCVLNAGPFVDKCINCGALSPVIS